MLKFIFGRDTKPYLQKTLLFIKCNCYNELERMKKIMKVYLAGALFNEAEIAQRLKEGKLLKERFPQLSIFNPIEQPFNEHKEKLPIPQEIFYADTKAVRECDIFIADLTNEDAGAMVELGIAIERKVPIIIGINSDIRMISANQYEIPTYGMNHYVLGGLLEHGYFVRSFQEAMEQLEVLLEKK